MIDYLLAEGRDLDALYLTHLHLDHAGGLSEILNAGIQIRQIYVPWNAEEQRLDERSLAILALARERGIPITSLARGDELRYNKTAIQVNGLTGTAVGARTPTICRWCSASIWTARSSSTPAT